MGIHLKGHNHRGRGAARGVAIPRLTVLYQTHVRGYAGGRTQADYVIRQTNGYDLGFHKAGETYELVANFWGAKIHQKQFIDQVTQTYTHKMLRATVEEQGFDVLEDQTLEDGTVRVVVGKWV